jgi:hypothetical protein
MKPSAVLSLAGALAMSGLVGTAWAQTTTYTTITTAPVAPTVTETTRSYTYQAPAPIVAPPASSTIVNSEEDEPNGDVLGRAVSGNTTIYFEAANGQDIQAQRLGEWDEFAQAHPRIQATLEYDPWLINDPGYLSRHPALDAFFASHPDVKVAMMQDPGNFAAIWPRPGE